MSKNSKIAVILAVLAFVALIVVLASAVFCVKKVQLVWYKAPSATLSAVSDAQFLEKSGVVNKSVFLLDRDSAISNIETSFPDVRVINLEVVWPNVMKLHLAERESVYAVPIKNGKFAIVDEYFKVLEVVDNFTSTKTNAILINTEAASNLDAQRADNINIFGKTVWFNIYNAFLELERDLVDFRAIVSNVTLTENDLNVYTHMGTTFKIEKPFANTRSKMRLAIKTFDLLTTEDYPDCVIEVLVNNEDKLISRVYKE